MAGVSVVVSPLEQTSSVNSSVTETASTVSSSLCSPIPILVTNPLTITEVWEIYIKAVKSQDQSADNVERQAMLLDLLLHMCTVEIRNGSVPRFSDMKSACNQLCKEFMTDILHITNKSEEEDNSQLQRYLLAGRGYQLLQVIHRKGVQNISGCRDLANLLASLLPWCLKFPRHSTGSQESDPDLDLLEHSSTQTPISQCFQRVYKQTNGKANQLKHQAMPRSRRSASAPKDLSRFLFYGKSTSNRRYSKRTSTDLTSKDLKKSSDNDSSEVATDKSKSKVKRKSRYYHIHSAHERQAQQKADSDSDDDDLYGLLQTVKKEDVSVSGFQLCLLVLELLLELTAADLDETSPGKFISLRILPQLLDCLSTIEEEKIDPANERYEKRAKQVLSHMTLRVVFSCCGIIATQQNGTTILTSQKVFETVLNAGQKHCASFPGASSDYGKHSSDLDLMSDCVIGLIHSLCIVYENLPFNLSFIKSAVSLLETFDGHGGFQMLSQCILYHDWLKCQSSDESASWPEDEPLKAFSTFLNTMKIVRVNYLHSMKCVKRKHQKCSYAQYFDHHHDILGIPSRKQGQDQGSQQEDKQPLQKQSYTRTQSKDQTVCLVASSTQFLLDLLVKVTSKPMRLDLMKIVYSSGFCCCMDLQDITSAFVLCAAKFTPAVRTFALDTLNKITLEHFSGSITHGKGDTQKVACSTCDTEHFNFCNQNKPSMHKKYGIRDDTIASILETKGLDSGFDSSDITREKLSALSKVSKWRPVCLLRTLLYASDESLAVAVAKHLMVLAIKGNPYLKVELFFSVYSNAMESVSRDKTLASDSVQVPLSDFKLDKGTCTQSLAKSVQVHCLSALPYLLQANCVTKAFLGKNGVGKLCELLEDDVLRVPVLRIFEALVVQDEQKLVTSLHGTQQQDCPCPYTGGAVIETFVKELSKRSFSNCNEPSYYDKDSKPRRIRHDSVVLSLFSLPVLVDLWQTCAKLCLQNHAFATLFQDSQGMYLYKTETLLLETLDILTSPNLIGFLQSHGSTEAEDSGMEADHVMTAELEVSDTEGFNLRVSLLESLMVVVGACYNIMEKQDCARYTAWVQMKERFRLPVKLKPSRVKILLDTVLNAAMPQLTSVLEYSYYKNIALAYMRDDDIYDEDEVRHLLQSGSEEEVEVTTEIGYDADSEGTHPDDNDRDKQVQTVQIQTGASHRVYFPPTFRLLMELLIWIQASDSDNLIVQPILHRLVQTVRADAFVVEAMCKQDVLSLILGESGFWSSLLAHDPELSVQDNLLVLIQYMGQHKLKSCDLQKILQLFQHSDIPMEQLLSKFLPIVENSQPMAYHCVRFPTRSSSGGLTESAKEVKTPTMDCLAGSVSPLLKTVSSFFKSPAAKSDLNSYGVAPGFQQQEVWTMSPLQLNLKDAIAWPPFQNGFTLALWLRLDTNNNQNYCPTMPMYDLIEEVDEESRTKASFKDEGIYTKYLHVVSIGTTEKLLEIWADTATNSLLFRLTSEVSDMGLVVREMPLTGVMSPARWQHLVVCYVESLDGSTLTGKTTVIIDGWQSHSFVLDHPFSAIRARHRSSSVLHPVMCLGHMVPDPCMSQVGTWSLGNLLLFKGTALSKENCFHLFTLGPNCESILKCDCSEDRARYAPHLHKNTILHSKISHDALVGLSKVDLTDLRHSVLLSYNPRHCTKMSVYPSVSRSSQVQTSGNLGYIPDSLLTQQPRVVSPLVLGHVTTTVNHSLEKALEETGGMAAILFLVAKVYERCPESMPTPEAEKVQSEALKVLLSVVHHSSQLQAEYINSGGHALLCKVLTSCRRVVGRQVLKVIMDAATTDTLYRSNPGSDDLVIRHKSDAVIRDVTVIDQIILQWHVWEGSGQGILELLFGGLAVLVREDHPYQQYNIKQYQVISLVSKIFKIYQERIQEGFPAVPISVSQSVVSIVQNMVGSPPDPLLIVDICDFLLMVHPAANTYINHSRSLIYFTLPWGLPPSPLTVFRQGLETGTVPTSTPQKEAPSKTASEETTRKAMKSLSQHLENRLEEKTYPAVEMMEKDKPELGIVAKPDLTDTDTQTTQFTKTDPKEETVKDMDRIGEHQPPLMATHNILENFESLYKKSSSLDGDESSRMDASGDAGLEGDRLESDLSISDVTETVSDIVELSMSNEDLSLNFDEDNIELLKLEQGLTAVCVGLLRMLASVIVMMPDAQVDKTFRKSIINPQTFIVLMQSSSSQIREAVIKVISSYLSRSSPSHTDSFLKMDGFHLMAAQLYQYPTHQEQMEAAVAIVMQRPFYVDEGLREDEVIEELSQIQQSAIPVMLALLGNSVGDLALCHNSLQFATKLFESSDVVAMVMMEQGLVEVICNMLQKLFENGSRSTDVEGMDENEILLSDLLDFLKVIAVREFSLSGPQHYQHFEDILVLLQEMERRERELQGLEARSTQTLRRFQYYILVAVMEVVEKATEECNHTSSFSLFNRMAPKTPQYAEGHSLPHISSSPALPQHRTLTFPSAQHFSLSGALGRFTSHHGRKSPGGYFVHPDQPFTEPGSGGDSDSSQDSWLTSVQSVNLPLGKPGFLRGKSVDISQGKVMRSNSLLQTMLSIGKRKKMSTVPISQKELIERLKKMVIVAVDIAVFSERPPRTQKKEIFLFEMAAKPETMDSDFLKRLFIFNYRAFETTLPQEKSSYKRTKNSIVWGAKDTLRVQFGRLLAFMLSDRLERDLRIYALSFIMGEQRGVDVLKLLITTTELANDLAYHVRNLLVERRQLLAKQNVDDGARFMNYVSSAGYHVISAHRQPTEEQLEILEERKKLISSKHESEKATWLKRKEAALNRIFHRLDSLSNKLCDNAMEVTQSVTQLQTAERNKFITYIKQKKTQSIQVKKQWQEIVQNLTHERAIWFDKKSYPHSWQLNPTEGPCRVRKRLQRGHLGILPKFLLKEYQCKLASETVDPPLIYLFEDDHQMSDSAALIYQLHRNKKIRYTCSCRAVSPNSESKGELLIGEDSVFFVADEAITDANYTQVLLGNKDQLSMTWPFEDVLEIHKRWYELLDTGLEIFLTNGKTCLLALKTAKERDDLFQHLNMLELPNRVYTCNLMDVIFNWENGHITNFEYLTHLNKLAGRSFNDLMQYPIMPFILRDYTSETLDLENKAIYRDLTKPVSVQEPRNEQKFLMNYSILKQEYDKCGKRGITGLRVAPYHYGSHYSNSGCVLHFLVRLPPFTKMFLNFQDQSFDIPDRTFHNLHTSWRLSSAESNTDVKELIPEFFFCHEFLRNFEGFDFGHRQNDEPVHDVVLPPWCEGNARLFTMIHRQALESDHVTDHIGAWIDLIFGYKQQGEPAVRAINVFHPATYFGLDVSSVKNPVDRKAIQTMVRTYGQTPKQLFTVPHSFKRVADSTRTEYQRQGSRSPQLKCVSGLKWGSFLGSPDRPEPDVTWQAKYSSQVASLVPLPRGYVFGIGAKSCLLVQHSQEKQKTLMTDTPSEVVWAAIVTWGQTDRFLKIINGLNKPAVNLIHYNQSDEVTCCVSVPDCRYLIVGGSSGVITVYNSKLNSAKESQLQVFDNKSCLYGHMGSVHALVVCKPYSILVSASQDGSCIIWDLNRLSYVRSITGHKSGVQVLAVSDTLGDIASVCHYGLGSYLYLHTVNAEYVAMRTCEDTILCLAYSAAPEGASINVIAGGLSSGVIRLWSSWDLTPVRDMCHHSLSATPIISLTFTRDSQRLYASSADGRVILWDWGRQGESRSPKFKPYLYTS